VLRAYFYCLQLYKKEGVTNEDCVNQSSKLCLLKDMTGKRLIDGTVFVSNLVRDQRFTRKSVSLADFWLQEYGLCRYEAFMVNLGYRSALYMLGHQMEKVLIKAFTSPAYCSIPHRFRTISSNETQEPTT